MIKIDDFQTTFDQWIDIIMHQSMHNFIRYSRESGLSMSQMGALFYLHRVGSSGVSDIGEHLDVTSAAVSQMVDRLVQQKLIHRSEDPTDRRVKIIELTEKGRQLINNGIHAKTTWVSELYKKLTPDECSDIHSAMSLMIEKTK